MTRDSLAMLARSVSIALAVFALLAVPAPVKWLAVAIAGVEAWVGYYVVQAARRPGLAALGAVTIAFFSGVVGLLGLIAQFVYLHRRGQLQTLR